MKIGTWIALAVVALIFAALLVLSKNTVWGWVLAIVLFAGIRERMELSDMPEWMKGFPGALISAGLMAIAFSGFAGMI